MQELFDAIVAEAPADVEIVNRFEGRHEDPDLDRYLADPKGFRR
jgi:hypothetical protein